MTKTAPMLPNDIHERWPYIKALATAPEDEAKEAWEAVFRARPDVMHRVIQEVAKRAYSSPGRAGQRPMPKEEDADLWGLLYGEHAEDPIKDALPRVMRETGRSERKIANKLTMSRTQFRRLLAGGYEPTMYDLREIADAVGKPPAYFSEYRRMMVVSAMLDLFEKNPGIVTSLYTNYVNFKA